MKITLGPNLYNWPTPEWTDFYARIADEAPVDRVVLGEVICSKRTPFRTDAIGEAVERLERAGKEVVLATLALPTLKREISEIAELAESERLIEVNDMAALHALGGRAHVVGPFINVYNEATLRVLEETGARTVCLPPELPAKSIETIAAHRSAADIEVFAFGRAPLAVSARCYHARIHNLTKDGCRYVCENDRDGLEVDTLDGQHFLAVNGIATMASGVTVLSEELNMLANAGVSRIRVSPQSCDMVAICAAYRDLIDGRIDSAQLLAAVEDQALPGAIVNGYIHGRAGASRCAPGS
ncbi:MAG TPA: U32 family peptidase [Hyphomicrobium sp.]|nr:U32 family peptidase [Hyphomicrobium sp.]